MTAATLTRPEIGTALARPWRERVWNVVKLHAANPWATIYLPLVVTVSVLAFHYVMWQAIIRMAGGAENLEPQALQTTGGGSWIAFYLMVAAIQAMNLTFPFALGFTTTRRDYFVGTLTYFSILAVGYASLYTLAAAIERGTDGWGVNGRVFAPGMFNDHPLWIVGFFWLMLIALMFAIGIASGAVFVRWKARGLVTMLIVIVAAIIGFAWAITVTESWDSVRAFFSDSPLAEVFAWTLVLTIPLNFAGYRMLRRATPRG